MDRELFFRVRRTVIKILPRIESRFYLLQTDEIQELLNKTFPQLSFWVVSLRPFNKNERQVILRVSTRKRGESNILLPVRVIRKKRDIWIPAFPELHGMDVMNEKNGSHIKSA